MELITILQTSASATRERSARGDRDARRAMRRYSGVVEGHPGIIESTHIEPLDEDYKEDGKWSLYGMNPVNECRDDAEGGRGRTMEQSMPVQAQSLKERVTTAAEGTAHIVYGIATGDQKAMQAGKEALGLDK